MQQPTPILSVPHHRSFFQMINIYIALLVVFFGFWQGAELLVLLGLGVGIMYWFTTPRRYHILSDRLVVQYGPPRNQVVALDTIFDVQVVRIPLTSGIFVRRRGKSGVIVRPRDMEEFAETLLAAMRAAGVEVAEHDPTQAGPTTLASGSNAPEDPAAPPDADARGLDAAGADDEDEGPAEPEPPGARQSQG